MRILALDLGTKTGWALRQDGGTTLSGTWVLATKEEVRQQRLDVLHRCCDVRFARLKALVDGLRPLNHCYFEDVEFSSSTQQTQLWASFRAVVVMMYPGVNIHAVPVGTLKKFATGKGNADKDAMRAAMLPHQPASLVAGMDDNEIDARHLLRLALSELKL
jgi:hypothetical protein